MSFFKKIQSNKKFKDIIIEDATSHKVKDFYHAGSITLNLLLSGKVNGGIPDGRVTMLAAPKSSMKTFITTVSASNFQRKGGSVIWLDSEFAFDAGTAKQIGLDMSSDKFILVQDNSIENIQSFIMNAFEEYNAKEDGRVMIVIDSLGTMITSKSIEDTLDNKDVQDMTQSKKKNAFSRMLLRLSGLHGATVVFINHLYAGLSMYDTGTVSGGSGAQYVASTILKITSKAKEKDKDGDIEGNVLTATTDKGRLSKENSKLKFRASYSEGISLYYGLLDDALEGGYIIKPSVGWYSRGYEGENGQKFREAQIYTHEFFKPIFMNTDFKQYLETKYSYVDSMTGEEKLYDTSFQMEE